MSLMAEMPTTNYTNMNRKPELTVHTGLTVEADLEIDLEAEEHTCRICLETNLESEEDLISPCKCKGSSKYVHRTCLNTWRASSTNPEAFYKCMECRYIYKYNNNPQRTERGEQFYIHCNTCQMNMATRPIMATMVHYTMFLFFGYIISIIDTNKSLYHLMQDDEDSEFEIYLFLGEVVYILLYIFLFIFIFIGLRNKRLYARYCEFLSCRYFVSLGGVLFCTSIFGYLALTLVIAFYFQLFLAHHYLVIRRLASIGENSIIDYTEIAEIAEIAEITEMEQ